MHNYELIAEPGKQTITIIQLFDAPLDLVYRAYTNPQLVPQWRGPKDLAITVGKMEIKRGGSWRVIHKDKKGNEYIFNGVYHEVIPHERITNTFEYEEMPGHISLETVVFEEIDGKTLLTGKSVFQSVEDRDGMINSGMERGAADSNERFSELLEKMSAKVG